MQKDILKTDFWSACLLDQTTKIMLLNEIEKCFQYIIKEKNRLYGNMILFCKIYISILKMIHIKY